MSIIEKIASVFEAGSNTNETYTEEQMEKFAKEAYLSANFSIIIPILLIVPFRYAPRAKKSIKKETVDKAKKAEKLAVYTILIWVVFILYIMASN